MIVAAIALLSYSGTETHSFLIPAVHAMPGSVTGTKERRPQAPHEEAEPADHRLRRDDQGGDGELDEHRQDAKADRQEGLHSGGTLDVLANPRRQDTVSQ
jgi:hypothetical protein